MARIFDVDAGKLAELVKEDLKKIPEIKAPKWAVFVKTGMHKERPPFAEDWWHMRAASVLRSVYKLGPIGVSKLRVKYGGKKNNGVAMEHFYRGSGNIIRKILQQLEAAGLIKKGAKGVHKGRLITGKGASLLDKAAIKIAPVLPKAEKPAAEAAEPAEKKVSVPKEKKHPKAKEPKVE
jgi:small subunit ribosomal protein S19e